MTLGNEPSDEARPDRTTGLGSLLAIVALAVGVAIVLVLCCLLHVR